MTKKFISWFSFVSTALLLTGCGQTGPLYLPKPQPPQSHKALSHTYTPETNRIYHSNAR